MNPTITTAFYQPNNNTDFTDDDTDRAGEDTNNDPSSKPVPPTMHVRDATPDPIGPAGPSQATPIQALGPITQPLLASRGQTTASQQTSESTQQISMQATDVNLADMNGQTRLMLAAQDGDLPTVQALLSNGADVNAANEDGRTALMYAAKKGDPAIVQALLGVSGINIEAQAFDRSTALCVAAREGKGDVVKALIDKGANVNITDEEGWTPLMIAIEEGHLTTVQALLSVPGIDINAKNFLEETAVYVAARRGKVDVVKALLENGADIKKVYESIKENFDRCNEDLDDLYEYDDGNHNDLSASLDFLMNYLAQRQANVGNLRTEATWASAFATSVIPPKASKKVIPPLQALALNTLIQQAEVEGPSLAQISFQPIRDQLLKQELSATQVVRLIGMFSSSPLGTALVQTLAVAIKLWGYRSKSDQQLIHNALRISRLIDEYEESRSHLEPKNINRWQVSGQTLLTRAAQAGDQMLVNALVKCGASFHLPDQHGNNALHAAVKSHKWSVCSDLLELGANPNTSDRSGVSTLTYLAQAFANEDQETAIRVATLMAPLLAKGYRLDRVVYIPSASEIRYTKTTILAILQSDLNRYTLYVDLLHANNVNHAEKSGATPLIFAAIHGYLTTLQSLIEKGADVNAADNNGWTVLMSAANQGHLATVQVLLDEGADIKQTNEDGMTVLDIIAIKEPNEVNLKLLALLKQYQT